MISCVVTIGSYSIGAFYLCLYVSAPLMAVKQCTCFVECSRSHVSVMNVIQMFVAMNNLVKYEESKKKLAAKEKAK